MSKGDVGAERYEFEGDDPTAATIECAYDDGAAGTRRWRRQQGPLSDLFT